MNVLNRPPLSVRATAIIANTTLVITLIALLPHYPTIAVAIPAVVLFPMVNFILWRKAKRRGWR